MIDEEIAVFFHCLDSGDVGTKAALVAYFYDGGDIEYWNDRTTAW